MIKRISTLLIWIGTIPITFAQVGPDTLLSAEVLLKYNFPTNKLLPKDSGRYYYDSQGRWIHKIRFVYDKDLDSLRPNTQEKRRFTSDSLITKYLYWDLSKSWLVANRRYEAVLDSFDLPKTEYRYTLFDYQNDWTLDERWDYYRDEKGRDTSIIIWEEYPYTQQFDRRWKYETIWSPHDSNSEELYLEKNIYRLYDDGINPYWYPYSFDHNTYDSLGHLTKTYYFLFGNNDRPPWTGNQTFFTYNQNNQLVESLREWYESYEEFTFLPDTRARYTYPDSLTKVPDTITHQSWRAFDSLPGWINTNRITYPIVGRDSNVVIYERYGNNTWLNESRDITVFNPSHGKLLTQIHQIWTDTSWRNSYKWENQYNSKEQQILESYYRWSGTIWEIISQKKYYYGLPVHIDPVPSNKLSVFPNPASQFISFDASGLKPGDFSYTLLDMSGRILKTREDNLSRKKEAVFLVGIQDLAQGFYLIKINQGDRSFQSRFYKE